MLRPSLAVVFVAVLATSVPASTAGSGNQSVPPRPGTANTSLDVNETATLWSRDDDSNYISNDAYREAYGERRSAMAQLANGTDITFSRPPATAATWTREDHPQFRPGSENVSVYPPGADLRNSTYIRDAHATVFAVTPSTKAHIRPNRTTWYVAPSGTVRGIVDYRVAVPQNASGAIGKGALDHRIAEVRLERDGAVLARSNGTHEPALRFDDLTGYRANLTLVAEIVVTTERSLPVGNHSAARTTLDRVTVRDTVEVVVYRPDPEVERARYPDDDTGIVVYTDRPWQGYVTDHGRVRGVWRFYTARDTSWDRLRVANATETRTRPSAALPVYVHAYPSRIGPRVEPTGGGPTLLQRWGPSRESPESTIGDNVTVGVVNRSYNATYGLAARHPEPIDRIRVLGIVRGVTRTIDLTTVETRAVRPSNLTLSVVDRTADGATLRVRLQDGITGEPIVLADPETPRRDPLVDEYGRSGYVTVAGQRLRTNTSGVATLTVTEAGVYRATYHPDSWLTYDPAYTRVTALGRYHPLMTLGGWLGLTETLVITALPFALALYAGRKLATMFETPYR